jgi:hypothetical protein
MSCSNPPRGTFESLTLDGSKSRANLCIIPDNQVLATRSLIRAFLRQAAICKGCRQWEDDLNLAND